MATPLLAGEPAGGAFSPDQLRAAFLFNFGAFVEWPPEASGEQGAFTIAVVDDRAVARELRRLIANRTVRDLPVAVREIDSVEEIGDARIVYLGATEAGDLRRLLRPLRNRPVLTVTNADGALEHGAVINFAIVERRVRFEVSLEAAREARLSLSSRLLALALRVGQSWRPGDRPVLAGRVAWQAAS